MPESERPSTIIGIEIAKDITSNFKKNVILRVCYPEIVDMYCMKVHSCTVYDGQGGPAVSVLDEDG